MIRLFWRFFIVFWLIQLLAFSAITLAVKLYSDDAVSSYRRFDPATHPPPHLWENGNLRLQRDVRMPPRPPIWRHPLFHLAIMFLGSLLFSALLARYFSAPIAQLKNALDQVAKNNWQTQLPEKLTVRRDEFGSLSRSFNQMALNIDAAVMSQRRLLHDVSHELRSPLARLHILAGLAKQSASGAAYAAPRLELETQKLESLVEEILTFCKLDSGMTDAAAIDVNLTDILSSICDDAALEAQEQQKTVTLHAPESYIVVADPALLYRALENVIRNAVKFTKACTNVTVTVTKVSECLYIHVNDSGPGVPESQLAKLFSPFFKAHSTHSGIGLGLSIAKRALQHCQGSITARNRYDGNTLVGFTVEITLPLP